MHLAESSITNGKFYDFFRNTSVFHAFLSVICKDYEVVFQMLQKDIL
ncbi:phage/plasmid primase, P4 family [Alicyclobacillus hesperidum URH17-3-68]|nr:phage/plasmid primase, P4 family [Alicyclobacillus hesperidum URH17-3-68]